MDESGLVRQLKELSELHATGAITDEEFVAAKAALLGGPRPGAASPGPGPVPKVASGGPAWLGGVPSGAGPVAPTGPDTADLRSSPPGGGSTAPTSAGRWVGHGGAITSGVGGLVTLLAFVALPLATVPFLGSITGANAAGFASQFGALGLLWLVPLLAVAVVGIAGWQIFGTAGGQVRAGSITIMVLAALVVLVYLIVLGAVQAETSKLGVSAPSFFGVGFWFAALAIVAAGIGGAVEMAAASRSAAPGGRSPAQDQFPETPV